MREWMKCSASFRVDSTPWKRNEATVTYKKATRRNCRRRIREQVSHPRGAEPGFRGGGGNSGCESGARTGDFRAIPDSVRLRLPRRDARDLTRYYSRPYAA